MHTKRIKTLFKRWVQFRVGAIQRLPCKWYNMHVSKDAEYTLDFNQFGNQQETYPIMWRSTC